MALVKSLGREGADVIAVDYNMDHLDEVKHVASDAICFDATDPELLRSHGITQADIVVIAIGESFEPVVVIAMELLNAGVKEVYGRANSDTQERILRRIGVTEIIYPERQLAERMGLSLPRRGMTDLLELGAGLSIVELEVPKSMVGYKLSELNLRNRYGINVLTVKKPSGPAAGGEEPSHETTEVAHPSTRLNRGDKMVVLGNKEDCRKLLDVH